MKTIFCTAFLALVFGSSGLPGSINTANAQTGPNWLSLDEGQVVASSDKKILFIFVEAEWCAFCKQMKKEVFPSHDVLSRLESRFATVSVDLDSKNAIVFNGMEYTERSFAQAMDVIATPTMIFADEAGRVLGETSGFYDKNRFLLLLSYLDSEQFGEMTFGEFEREWTRGS